MVDEDGEPVGTVVERAEAHARGVLHRTSHVWVLRRRGGAVEVLLQLRAAAKESYPERYDVSSAGHIPAGAGYVDSALRELREELGLEAAPAEIVPCGVRRIRRRERFGGREFVDNQVSRIFLLWRMSRRRRCVSSNRRSTGCAGCLWTSASSPCASGAYRHV